MQFLKKSYNAKLILVFTLLNLVGTVLLSILFYAILDNVIYDNYKAVVEDSQKQIESEIIKKINDIERISHMFIFDQSFHIMLQKSYEGYEKEDVLINNILYKGKVALVLTDLKPTIQLYLDNDTIPEHYYNEDNHNRGKFEVYHLDRITNNEDVKTFLDGDEFERWFQIEDDPQKNRITLLSRLINLSTMQESGLIRISVDKDEFFKTAVSENYHQKIYYNISRDGSVIFETGEQADGKVFELDKELYKGLFIYMQMPYNNITNGFNEVFLKLCGISLACFLLSFVIIVFFSKILMKNLNEILVAIEKFKQGEYDYDIKIKGDDEFLKIGTALRSYAQSTDCLINDVYEVMIQKQDMELQMLQAKINPHFMYNIFSVISQLAQDKKNDDIVDIANITSRFYRSALSKNTAYNNLADELKILEEYFNIMDIQRKGAIHKIYDIDENILDCLVPNFILQPIVENAIKHAMVNGKITIKVGACLADEGVLISVEDNGIGMRNEQQEEIFKFKVNSGYGLYNINERIRLRYDDPRYTIRCESEYGKGTRITLLIPYKTAEELGGEDDV